MPYSTPIMCAIIICSIKNKNIFKRVYLLQVTKSNSNHPEHKKYHITNSSKCICNQLQASQSSRLKLHKQGIFLSLILLHSELLLFRFHEVPSGRPGSSSATKTRESLPAYSVKGEVGWREERCAFAFICSYGGQRSMSVSSERGSLIEHGVHHFVQMAGQ